MRINQFAALALLSGATQVALAQTPAPTGVPAAAPTKPTVETATTPVEQIKLNGKTLPLNIKTLAEMQRLAEEKALREQIQEALSTGGAVSIPAANLQAATPATPVATAAVEQAAPVAAPKRARPVVPVNTLMAVYGPDNNLKAEVFVGKKEARQLKKGDSFGNFRVASISQNGIQLESLNGSRSSRFIPVGQRLAN